MTFLLIPPYLIFAFFIMRAVLKKQLICKRKWRMGLLTAFLLYLPFGWDVILGRAVFYTLCATQGGVHVYQTVELGPEYWNEDGSPKFILENGELNEKIFKGKYHLKRKTEKHTEYISYYDTQLINTETNNIIADRVMIDYLGGWFVRYTGFFVTGSRCPTESYGLYPDLLHKVFIAK